MKDTSERELGKIAEGIKFGGGLVFLLGCEIFRGFENALYQGVKHCVYHIGGVKHFKIDCPSDADFFYYERC